MKVQYVRNFHLKMNTFLLKVRSCSLYANWTCKVMLLLQVVFFLEFVRSDWRKRLEL